MSADTSKQPLPPWDVLEQRIDEQRQALWRASAIVQLAATAADSRDPIDGTLTGNQAKDIELALLAARGLIDGVTGELEVNVLLRREDGRGQDGSDEATAARP